MLKHLIFIANVLLAIVTLTIFAIKHLPPSQQFFLAGGTLFLPALMVVHFLFVVYWLVRLNKRALLSITVLLIGYQSVPPLFAFNFKKETTNNVSTIKLASYNILHFKNQIFTKKKENNYLTLLKKNRIDILGLQEANFRKENVQYPYNNYEGSLSQSWIYTKHKIIKGGALNIFEVKGRGNDFTYADVIIKNDTLRVYNTHFHSYKFSKEATQLKKAGIKEFVKKIKKVFILHEQEVDKLIRHIKSSPYPVVVMGDFNNNTYSYEYSQLIKKCNLKDTFVEAGIGFGATFDFKYFPTRIDYILVPKRATVHSHKVIKIKHWSDHYPVISEISF